MLLIDLIYLSMETKAIHFMITQMKNVKKKSENHNLF